MQDDPERGPLLEMNIVITDPVHLDGPWEMTWRKPYAADEYEFTRSGLPGALPILDQRNIEE